MSWNSNEVNRADSCCALLVSEGVPAPRNLIFETGSKAPRVGLLEKLAKMMSMKWKTKTKLILLSLSEKRLRKHAERRAAEAERRAAEEKCLRQDALQGRDRVLQSLLNFLCCKKRAKRDVAQSETAASTPDEWLVDPCGPQDSECSADDGGKIHDDSRRVFSIVMSEYQEPKKLRNALNDAEAVGKTFGKLNYKVTSPAKNVPKNTLQGMFSKFLKTLDTKTYTVVLHLAGHGFEQGGRLVLDLIDGSAVYLDELLFDLNDQLDKLVLQSKSKDDPVHSAGILVIWDACREALPIPIRSKGRKVLRERQQAIIHSCMFGGCSEEAVADSKNSPLILALSDLLGTNTPFTVFELAEHLNARDSLWSWGPKQPSSIIATIGSLTLRSATNSGPMMLRWNVCKLKNMIWKPVLGWFLCGRCPANPSNLLKMLKIACHHFSIHNNDSCLICEHPG